MGLGRSTHRSELVLQTTGRVPCQALCLCRCPASSHTPMGYTPIVQMRKQTQGGAVTCIRPGREMAEPGFETQSESAGFAGQTCKAAPSTPDPSQGLPSEVVTLPGALQSPGSHPCLAQPVPRSGSLLSLLRGCLVMSGLGPGLESACLNSAPSLLLQK